MRIVNLIENTLGEKEVLFEHGLSFYIETTHHKIMLDAGQTNACLENAKYLGIDLTKADTFVLSHGHYDHSGGLLEFAKQNPDAKIYIHKNAGLEYYHGDKYIGIDPEILNIPKLIEIENIKKQVYQNPFYIDKEISIFSDIKGRLLRPQGNFELKRKEDEIFVQDEFEHEQYLVIENEGKIILLSGCAHNGILNILEKFKELYKKEPDIVISGFHMKKKIYTKKDETIFIETAKQLQKTKAKYYTGHCTGEYAYEIMKKIMGEQLQYVHSGEEIFV